jgi:glycosyltransferase involved in cell wall biosynthesis
MIRVGLDVSVTQFNSAGASRYSREVVQALHKASTSEFELIDLNMPARWYFPQPGLSRKLLVLFWEFVYSAYLLPYYVRSRHIDLLHCTAPLPMPVGLRLPIVTSMHDVIPFSHPQWFTPLMALRLQGWWLKAARSSVRIIASSKHTQQAIVQYLNFQSSNISVIYLGNDIRPIVKVSDFRQPYILAVGTIEPRKNLLRVLEAFSLVRGVLDPHLKLCLVGGQGWGDLDLVEVIGRFDLKNSVELLGFVSDERLAELYTNAQLLVYPSLYEGFGFPILEAMACGCPVITSRLSSIPEIAGDAAVLVDPMDVEQLANAIRHVLQDDSLILRMRNQGRERSKLFSWKHCAEETLSVYRSIVKDS